MKCTDSFYLQEDTYLLHHSEIVKKHETLLQNYRHVRYHWLPYTKYAIVTVCNPVELDSDVVDVVSAEDPDSALVGKRLFLAAREKEIEELRRRQAHANGPKNPDSFYPDQETLYDIMRESIIFRPTIGLKQIQPNVDEIMEQIASESEGLKAKNLAAVKKGDLVDTADLQDGQNQCVPCCALPAEAFTSGYEKHIRKFSTNECINSSKTNTETFNFLKDTFNKDVLSFAHERENLLSKGDPLDPAFVSKVNEAEMKYWRLELIKELLNNASKGHDRLLMMKNSSAGAVPINTANPHSAFDKATAYGPYTRIADSTDILGFMCGGSQNVLEVCFDRTSLEDKLVSPFGSDKMPRDLRFVLNILFQSVVSG